MIDVIGNLFKSIDEKEQAGWRAFVAEHKTHGLHVTGNGISIELMADTAGGYCIIMKCTCGDEENVTNFENW